MGQCSFLERAHFVQPAGKKTDELTAVERSVGNNIGKTVATLRSSTLLWVDILL